MMLIAEFADLGGKVMLAAKNFECAILIARNRGLLFDEAKCEQRYGEFLGRQKKTKLSSSRILRALDLYDHWGAHALSAELRARHTIALRPVQELSCDSSTPGESVTFTCASS